MRKRITAPPTSGPITATGTWLDVERMAEVELTSEDPDHPIESALRPGEGTGWRASEPGRQVIRLHFDVPQHLRHIRLVFHEPEVARTQEFTLRWSADAGQSYREVLRQQYNFSPPGATREIEDYEADLAGVSSLELDIVPDVSAGGHHASLEEWLLA